MYRRNLYPAATIKLRGLHLAKFIPEKSKTNVDFIAWSVARMEHEKRSITAPAVAGNMCATMAEQFHSRLMHYRLLLSGKESK